MNIKELDITSLNVLLSVAPPSKKEEIQREIKRKEAAEKWRKTNDKYIKLNLN